MSVEDSATPRLEYALLGLLRQRPMHAYEMHQMLAEARTLGRIWRVKQSNLYAYVARLEKAGYLAMAIEQPGVRPPRKVLSLTPAGREAFERWTTEPVAHGRDFRIEFLAKLFFAGQSGPRTVADLIAAQKRACESWLVALRAQTDALGADRSYDRLVLQFRTSQIEAIVRWLETCADTLAPSAHQ